MQAKAVDFVYYTVSDLDESVPFYRDVLGLTLESHIEDVGWAEFGVPPTTLALRESTADAPGEPGTDGASGLALAVDDVEAAVEDLREADATVVMDPFETGVCEMARVADPDGNQFTLHRRNDGTQGRRDPFE